VLALSNLNIKKKNIVFLDISSEAIKDCGLFISEHHPFLAASPDGVIGDDGLIEIKCPYTARDFTPENAIISKKNQICIT
jgi:hypothetical protein